jgi:hypothetical protein
MEEIEGSAWLPQSPPSFLKICLLTLGGLISSGISLVLSMLQDEMDQSLLADV